MRERRFPSASYCRWRDNLNQIGSYATVQLIYEGTPDCSGCGRFQHVKRHVHWISEPLDRPSDLKMWVLSHDILRDLQLDLAREKRKLL